MLCIMARGAGVSGTNASMGEQRSARPGRSDRPGRLWTSEMSGEGSRGEQSGGVSNAIKQRHRARRGHGVWGTMRGS